MVYLVITFFKRAGLHFFSFFNRFKRRIGAPGLLFCVAEDYVLNIPSTKFFIGVIFFF